jgi:cobalamin biosynthesis protein CobC
VVSVSDNIFHGGEPPETGSDKSKPWLDLSTGISPWAWPIPAIDPAVFQALPRKRDEEAALGAAAIYYGLGADGDICLGPGSQALLQAVPEVLPPGNVAILEPTYGEHGHRWSQAGHVVDAVADLTGVGPGHRYVVLVNPNNPTGRVHTKEELLALATELSGREGYLVVDEAFCDVQPTASLAAEAGRPGLLVLRSFGKFFGLAGVRIGFLLGPSGPLDLVRRRTGLWSVNGPALEIARQACADISWIAAHRQRLAQQAERLKDLLADHGEIIGETSLFLLLQSSSAPQLLARLARHQIHIRHFPDHPAWLRFGLPGEDADWLRLQVALADQSTV